MKLKKRIDIHLKDFVEKGKFGGLKLGKTKEWILNNFPDPDDISGNNMDYSLIWTYGKFELHFDIGDKKTLYSIFTDYMPPVDGGEFLKIDPWIFKRSITLIDTISHLNTQKIDFKIEYLDKYNYTKITIIKSNVELTFDHYKNRFKKYKNLNEIIITSISLFDLTYVS
jgi:hypothetical protein